MNRRNQEAESQQEPQPQTDAFDALLQSTLRARSQSDPRAGFHARLAETLRQADGAQPGRGGWWAWFSAAASLAVLGVLIAATYLKLHIPHASGPAVATVTRHTPALPLRMTPPGVMPAHRQIPHAGQQKPAARRISPERQPTVLAKAAIVTLPKLDTFPSSAADDAPPFGSGDPVPQVSPEAAQAMLSLQQQQARPITLTAINLDRPLFGDSQ